MRIALNTLAGLIGILTFVFSVMTLYMVAGFAREHRWAFGVAVVILIAAYWLGEKTE